MSNNIAGKFTLLPSYKHDLSRAIAGDCKVIPSRFMILNKTIDALTGSYVYGNKNIGYDQATVDADIAHLYNSSSSKVIQNARVKLAELNMIIPYLDLNMSDFADRGGYNSDGTWINGQVVDVTDAVYIPGVVDLNFLGSDAHNGYNYTEMICLITPDVGRYFYTFDPNVTDWSSIYDLTSIDNNFKGSEITEGEILDDRRVECTNNQWIADNSKIEFKSIILFYDVIEGDQVTLKDMPMGVFTATDTQYIYRQEDVLYGGGTTWSTRIGIRIVDQNLNDPQVTISGAAGDTYNTLAKVLNGFGDCMAEMNKVTSSHMHQLNDIKSYLTEFKNNRTANVPVFKQLGDKYYWEINGKLYGFDIDNVVRSLIPPIDMNDIKTQVWNSIKNKVVTHDGASATITTVTQV